MIKNQIDVIVRFHDITRLVELKRCLFSLYGQQHRPLHIIVVTQRFTAEEQAQTQTAIAWLDALPDAPTLQMLNWGHELPQDARTDMLNLGLSAAQGQYLAFLDFDDVLYPEAYRLLVRELERSKTVVAFASIRTMDVEVYGEYVALERASELRFKGRGLRDLFRHNFCPIHSYLMERTAVSANDLLFDTRFDWEEDYEFLLRICANYSSSFAALRYVIGDYNFLPERSQALLKGDWSQADGQRFAAMVQAINQRRRAIMVAPSVCIALGLRPSAAQRPVTVWDVSNSFDAQRSLRDRVLALPRPLLRVARMLWRVISLVRRTPRTLPGVVSRVKRTILLGQFWPTVRRMWLQWIYRVPAEKQAARAPQDDVAIAVPFDFATAADQRGGATAAAIVHLP